MEDFHPATSVNATSIPAANSTSTSSTTLASSQDEDDPLDWMYIMFGVLIWIALIIGCGFAWTQLCKAFYFSSNVCSGCVGRMRRNPGIKWLLNNKFFKIYFGNDSCCGRCNEVEDEDDNDGDPVSRRRSGGDGQSRTGDLGRVNNGCDNSNSNTDHAAPPPPYDVALYMRRPQEGELDEGACNLGRESGNLV